MFAPKRILVPVDFSEPSMAALQYAAELARSLGAAIDVLHVWEPPAYVTPQMMVLLATEQIERPIADLARIELDRTMKRFLVHLESDPSLEAHGRLELGNPTRAILRLAEDEGYDLIVMATHGRRGLSRFMLGSVAEKVSRLGPCPVLTVHLPADKAPGA